MSGSTNRSNTTFAALRVRNFRLYMIGQMISVSGTWMQAVAQGWLVLQLTGSPVGLGVAVALQYLPTMFFGFYGGLVADRLDKRKILYATQSVAGVLALILGILVTSHHVTVMAVYVLAGLLGVVNLFDMPARHSFVQQMVGRELIPNAVSLNSALMNSGRLIGPSLAAGLIAVVGMAVCFYANAVTYVAVIVALWMMRTSELLPMKSVDRQRGQLRLGIKYVASSPLLRNTILAAAVVGTFAFNFAVYLPLLARVTFHQRTATGYGLLMGAMGLGAVIGGLFVAHRSRPTPKLLATLALGFGVFLTLVGMAPSLFWAEMALIPTGAFSLAFISTSNASLQIHSSEHMRGRVMSLFGTAVFGTVPIGSLLMGLIIGATNPRFGIVFSAVLTLAIGVGLVVTYGENVRSTLELQGAYTD